MDNNKITNDEIKQYESLPLSKLAEEYGKQFIRKKMAYTKIAERDINNRSNDKNAVLSLRDLEIIETLKDAHTRLGLLEPSLLLKIKNSKIVADIYLEFSDGMQVNIDTDDGKIAVHYNNNLVKS